MNFLIVSIIAVFGLIVGSFANALIWRLNDEKAPKFWQGRSVCPNCRKQIPWQDNIPLISFGFLGGRCQFCHRKISWRYPLVEFLTMISFVFVWLLPGYFGEVEKLVLLGVVVSMIVIFFSDLIYGLIPDEMIVFGSFATLVFNQLKFGRLGSDLLVGLLSGLSFFAIVVITRFKGMGLGDVKLAFLIGLILGWPKAAVAFWSAFVIGGLLAVGLLLLKRVKFSATIPLGPFLVVGTIISALWSNQLLHLMGL